MRRRAIPLLCLTALLCVLLAACGGKDSAAGFYQGQYTMTGVKRDRFSLFSLQLEDDGTGVQTRSGLTIDVTWSLEGRRFSMTETYRGMELSYTGTLEGKTLTLYNGDPDDPWTTQYVYEKE